jgi:hypothetical protein
VPTGEFLKTGFFEEENAMRRSHANIDGAAALLAAFTTAAAFGPIAVAARLLPAVRARRGIDRALRERRRGLGLDLRNGLGNVLGLQQGDNRDRQRGNLHGNPRLTSTTNGRFSHACREKSVNHEEINAILSKKAEIGCLQEFTPIRGRS